MTTTNKTNRPSNFVVFTLGIVGQGGNLSDKLTLTGKSHSTARGFLLTGKKDKPSPFFNIKAYAFDENVTALVDAVSKLAAKNQVTVKGRLGYSKYESDNGTREKIDVIVSHIEGFDSKAEGARASNFVMLTLRTIKDGGVVDFTTDGRARGKVSAMLSTGKDANGEYKPPFFVDVVSVSKDDSPTPVIDAIANLQKGNYFTVKGQLSMDEWEKDGEKRQSYSIWANSVEPFYFEGQEPSQEEPNFDEELAGEPA